MPDDIIAPRVLTPGGLLVLGGAPKVGKSDFLISWLVHMAAGVPFLGFTPPRPLRVFYLQAEIQYHYLRERMQQIALPAAVIAAARDTFIATPKLKLLLDAEGVARVAEAIRAAFPDAPPDIIVIDPIRNLFDGGPEGGGENDNTAMMFFLKDRVELLREAVNPDAGVILAHHTRKASKHQVKDDPFLALSGASALRGFYTSGLLMHRPDEDSTVRRLEIELRNGPALPGKLIDKVKGEWVELNPMNERLVRKEVGAKLDAERLRKHDVILGMLLDEAAERAPLHRHAVRRDLREPGRSGQQAHHPRAPQRARDQGLREVPARPLGVRLPRHPVAVRLSLRRGHAVRRARRGGRSGHRRGHHDRPSGPAQPLQMPPVRALPAGRKPRRLGLPGGARGRPNSYE